MSLFGAKTTLRGVSHYGAMGAALNSKRTSFEQERLREIGLALKKSRESFRLTAEHVAGELYVTPDRIRALESGDWSFANSDVYARGYLRNYADYLGLDYKNLMAKLHTPPTATEQPTTATPVLRKSTMPKQDIKHWLMLVMAALFALIAVLILVMQEQKKPVARTNIAPIPDYLLHYMGTQDTSRIFWGGCLHEVLPDIATAWECYAPQRYHAQEPMVPSIMHQLPMGYVPYLMMAGGKP